VFDNLPDNPLKFHMVPSFAIFLGRIKSTSNFEKGVDMIVKYRDGGIPQQFRVYTAPVINDALKGIEDKKERDGLKEQSDYIKSKLPADKPRQ
jgi:aminopeptidase N